MTKKQRKKKRLEAQMHITPVRKDTWNGFRPKTMANTYFKTNRQIRRENAEICRLAARDQG